MKQIHSHGKLALPSCLVLTLTLLAGCGGDGTQSNYTIGGSVSGLATGTQVTLLNNGSDGLTLKASGAFTFATQVASNAGYAVTVGTQPLGQSCAVSNGSGTATDNVTNVAIACSPLPAQVTTLAGSGTAGSADGTGSDASFRNPYTVALDASGNVYVADRGNNMIRKISPAGVVTTLAGSATAGSADGTGSTASFNNPYGVAVDASGNVYVADGNNNMIRKITPAGMVTSLAGSTTAGSADGTGAAAAFNSPSGIAVDASGNVYVADASNHMIRKITPAGVVTTLAGSPTPGRADGTGAAASFYGPTGVAVDAGGNLYVAERYNHTIRKITPAGVVTTLAGSGTTGKADGTGSAASFRNPSALAVDAGGNLYVADSSNSMIRKITPAGMVTTLAGSGTAGRADGAGPAASFRSPLGVAVDTSGDLYVADTSNNMIRKIAQVQLPR